MVRQAHHRFLTYPEIAENAKLEFTPKSLGETSLNFKEWEGRPFRECDALSLSLLRACLP